MNASPTGAPSPTTSNSALTSLDDTTSQRTGIMARMRDLTRTALVVVDVQRGFEDAHEFWRARAEQPGVRGERRAR